MDMNGPDYATKVIVPFLHRSKGLVILVLDV